MPNPPPCNAFQHCFPMDHGIALEGTVCRCGERVLDRRYGMIPALWLMAAGIVLPSEAARG
jgi:hypothetical protein